jgi:hypothetical protein
LERPDWIRKFRLVIYDQMLTESISAFILIGVCLIIHCTGIIFLAVVLVRRRPWFERRTGFGRTAIVMIVAFTILILLHIAENCIWAAFYNWRGLLGNYETSLYFSLGTYTTIGYGDVVLPEKWRLLGALEGISGVLLCGLSTAFLFSIMNVLFQSRIQRMNREADSSGSARISESVSPRPGN